MTTQSEKIVAAQTVAAGLRILLEFGETMEMPAALSALADVEAQIMEALPPWQPEVPDVPATWSEVHAGDHVQAPNGEWYKVDAWSRTGETVKVLLIVNGATVPTTQPAGVKVMVRHTSPEGRARDMFAAAGIDTERI